MSQPQTPKPAKLIAGFFVKDKALAADIAQDLQDRLGPVDMVSAWLPISILRPTMKKRWAGRCIVG
jgi:5,10-methenyltetrahydromethanopterin hydrogenase